MYDVIEGRKNKFLGMLALKFRLSLSNLCRIKGIEINDSNKELLFKNIIKEFASDDLELRFLLTSELVREYNKRQVGKYPDIIEVQNGLEEMTVSNFKRTRALKFINEFESLQNEITLVLPEEIERAEKNNDLGHLKQLKEELQSKKYQYDEMQKSLSISDEDKEFETFVNLRKIEEKVRNNFNKTQRNISPKEGLVISRYRYLHAVSKVKMSEYLGIDRETLTAIEERNKDLDPLLYFKIKKLDEFLRSYYVNNDRRK